MAETKDGDRKDRDRELDDFWDISRLVPAKPGPARTGNRSPLQGKTQAPQAVEVEFTPASASGRGQSADTAKTVRPASLTVRPDESVPAGAASAGKTTAGATPKKAVPEGTGPLSGTELGTPHYVPPHTAGEQEEDQPMDDYSPDGVLLHRVQVYAWRSNYHYFDQFTKDVERYAAMEPRRTGEVRQEPFFSFFPQYAQLSRRQLAWYLTWRDRVRHGSYPDTDYAYILLYLFELINLPFETAGGGEAARIRDGMADLWMAYRKAYPQLDHYMCEWLCDFCLLHHLNAPVDRLAPALDEIVRISQLKEFYLSDTVSGEGHDMESARILLRYCCQYDYHKSKFAAGEHGPLFDRVIPGGIAAVLPLLLGQGGKPPLIQLQDSTMTRDAYTGALCAYQNKRRILVSYTSFSRSHELRFLVGDMVRHMENRLRSWIGVRSRLSVMSLPAPVKDALDAYLAPLAPARPAASPAQAAPRPAYEALYDLPRKEVSLADAAAIERDSWETTRILTAAFGGDGGEEPDTAPEPPRETATPAPAAATPMAATPTEDTPTEDTPTEDTPAEASAVTAPEAEGLGAALGPLCDFVRLALAEDRAGQRSLADAWHTMPDALADRVNSITADNEIFDVILEDRGDGTYVVLEDYRETVRALLEDAP